MGASPGVLGLLPVSRGHVRPVPSSLQLQPVPPPQHPGRLTGSPRPGTSLQTPQAFPPPCPLPREPPGSDRTPGCGLAGSAASPNAAEDRSCRLSLQLSDGRGAPRHPQCAPQAPTGWLVATANRRLLQGLHARGLRCKDQGQVGVSDPSRGVKLRQNRAGGKMGQGLRTLESPATPVRKSQHLSRKSGYVCHLGSGPLTRDRG